MRIQQRQVRTTFAAKIAFLLVALSGAGLLAGCGASLNSSFTNLDSPKADAAALSGEALPAKADEKKPERGKRDRTAGKAVEALTASATPGNVGYKIGPQDLLEFSVFKAPELLRVAPVSEVGTINLPLIGEIQASGRTASELEKEVAARLGKKYLQSPQVTILVKEYNSQRVTIEGAVKKPGVYPLKGRTTLLQMVAMAEGVAELSDQTVAVFRVTNGQRTAARFDLAEIRTGNATDPVLQSGDTIVAPNSATKEAFGMIIKAIPLATFAALAL